MERKENLRRRASTRGGSEAARAESAGELRAPPSRGCTSPLATREAASDEPDRTQRRTRRWCSGNSRSARNDLCVWPAVAQQSQIARTKRLACDTRTTAEMRHIPGSVDRSVGMTDLPGEICVPETHLHFFGVFMDIFLFVNTKNRCVHGRAYNA